MRSNYQLPKEYSMTKKEEEEMSEELTTKVRIMAEGFLKGIFFFITAPIYIYNKIKQNKITKK